MVVWSLAMSLWVTNLLILALLAVALLLILTVLIQRPQGGGLSAAFGSAGSGQTAFGTKTGDALTVFTVIMFSLFVLVAIGLNFGMRPAVPSGEPSIQQAPGSLPVPGGSSIPGTGSLPTAPPADVPAPSGATGGEEPGPEATPASPAPPTTPTPTPTTDEPPVSPPAADEPRDGAGGGRMSSAGGGLPLLAC